MATEISAVISWHEVLHPDIGDRGKWNFPWHGTAGQCWGRFVADGDTTGVSARRVISTTAPAQRHSQATYLADGALGVNTVNRGCKTAAVILPGYCTPHSLPFMSLCPDKAHGYKVKVQSENISASHSSSQPVMMTG